MSMRGTPAAAASRRVDRAFGREVAAHDGGDEDRDGAGGAGFVDVAGEIGAEGGLRVGFAGRALAGTVVVAELDEDVFGATVDGGLPQAFVPKAF
jgi:hypothetical protein